jgi:hypothetical protein
MTGRRGATPTRPHHHVDRAGDRRPIPGQLGLWDALDAEADSTTCDTLGGAA